MTVDEWLIDAIKIRPIIWDTKNENYKNTKLKNEAYDEIANEYNIPVKEIKRKWHSVRSAFSRELRMRTLYSNVGQNEKRTWKHFQKLMFLQDECQLELDGQVENDYTIQIVSEDDASSNLMNSTENDNQSSSTIKQNLNTKKRKLNSKTDINSNSTPTTAINHNSESKTMPKSNQMNNFNFNDLNEDQIFGYSIAASLRKFDDKKKEIVKLKLQEVIVQHLNE